MVTVSFNGRRASPHRISVGVREDNLCETVQFDGLPTIGQSQTAYLYWAHGDAADVVALIGGCWSPTATVTQYTGALDCYVKIVSGSVVWDSEPFDLVIAATNTTPQRIDQLYPTAIQQGLDLVAGYAVAANAASAAAAEAMGAAVSAADAADGYADNAEAMRDEAAGIMGLATFAIDTATGVLSITYPTPYQGATFAINNNGFLEVTT